MLRGPHQPGDSTIERANRFALQRRGAEAAYLHLTTWVSEWPQPRHSKVRLSSPSVVTASSMMS
jgi:hypothetical protein